MAEKLDDQQKRAFIALACKVAWADGVVDEQERGQVTALLRRLGSPVSEQELAGWLADSPPPAELADLSPALGELFIYEAWQLVQADGAIDDAEIALVEGLLTRTRQLHEGVPVARITPVKR